MGRKEGDATCREGTRYERISVVGFKKFKQTYVNYVRTGRPLLKKKKRIHEAQNIHKALVSTRHQYT